MIYTVTFNPALDYVMHVEKMRTDDINRTTGEELLYGGKGINVSVILTRLGVENRALGFTAGFTGRQLKEMLDADGIANDFVDLEKGFTRINVKVKSDVSFDINALGPDIMPGDLQRLMDKLSALGPGDTLVLAGSIPPALPEDTYEKIMAALAGREVRFVVDTTGQSLLRALNYKPFLIKPNHHELGDLFGVKVKTLEEIKTYAHRLQQMGARNVLVSRGKDGAALIAEDGACYEAGIIDRKPVNSVGCGDSMVAGFVAGWTQTGDYGEALLLGAAAGNATAFSIGLADKNGIEEARTLLKK